MIRLQINNLTNIKIINVNKNTLALSCLFFSFTTFVIAQEAPTTSGGDATGSGGSVAFSIGQVVYVTNTGSTGTEAEGVQQPYEVICSFVLQHTEDPVKEIKFIKSVMKGDATLVLVNEPYRLVPTGMDENRFVIWGDDKIDIDQKASEQFNLIGRFDYYNRTDKCLSLWKKK